MLTFSKWQYIHQKSKALYQICLIEQRRMKYDAVRVRFAPSPTGFLHIGGLRTALYNYMFAKKHKSGQFILRIEDTDQTRVVQDAKENLLSSLEWAGIFPDESFAHGGEYGPYLQSERLHHYQRYADELVENGSAYHCFCTQQRLAILKKDQNKRNEIPRYDNRCRHLSKEDVQEKLASGASSVIRLKHTSGIHTIVDALYGEIGHDLASVEGDSVLLKSDGFPTYHLANVVDDHLMKISHVIRGNEWLLSTPKHALIYKCLGWKEPVFMHLPLLANADGTKLSKRQGDVFVEHYKDQGYTASAILNFIAFYGAGFSDLPTKFPIGINNTAEILEVLTNAFDYNKLLLSKAKVEFHKLIDFSTTLTKRQILSQNKSEIVNDLYKQAALKYREDLFLKQETYSPTEIEHYISSIVDNRKGHIVKLIDLVSEHYKYLWVRPNITSRIHEATVNIVLLNMESFLAGDDHLTKLKKFLVHQAEENNIQFSSLMKLIRKVLTGFEQGPGVQEVIKMLGRREAKFRINSYRNFVCSQNR